MQDALERISRKLVNAKNAGRIYNYVCPECSAPVILRAGPERPAYFAHASGLSDEDCARYAAGFGSSAAHEHIGAPHDYVNTLQLRLRIKRVGAEYGWALDIAVPTFRVNSGSIVIDVGGRTSEINLEGNVSLYRTISAVPGELPYRIIEVKPLFSRLASLDKTCAALNCHFATVFGPIDRPVSAEVGRSSTLRAECTYAFIWGATCSPVFPDELFIEALASREKWRGALVTIPHQMSKNCSTWLEQFTLLKLAKAAPAIVPLWPPLLRATSAQRIETLPKTPFSFFVEHTTGTSAPPVFARSPRDERVAQAESHHAPIYELAPEGDNTVQLACTKGPRLDVDFQLDLNYWKSIRPGVIKLTALDENEGLVESVLHSSEASDWFSKIRSREISFKSMNLPTGAKGQVKVKKDSEWGVELELYVDGTSSISSDSLITTQAELANRLIKIILEPTLSVMIDFSALGRAIICGEPNFNKSEGPGIPDSILKRIRQYFIQFPEVRSVESRRERISDVQLLHEFKICKPTVKSLAHHRFIQKNIFNRK